MSVEAKVLGLLLESCQITEIQDQVSSAITQALALYGYENEEGLGELHQFLIAYQACINLLPGVIDYYTKRANSVGVGGTKLQYADRLAGLKEIKSFLSSQIKELKKTLGFATDNTKPDTEFLKVEENGGFYSS